ncbi:response regulator [Nostocaceae cyanobacterium CENA357]|uniref:Response regulator n=1 Tax=Atlanticothrix silvestris CENA357 TaxID=1725252 RepID=A0A8J7HFN4_9CYAN|nr:response regulator [Atlanticothrix silvestris]MBH8554131.1 response regulator [Atlanticothrix silvestris CENA357]
MYESSKKILVIEDDNVTRNLFVKGLKAEGFEIIDANSGLDGIQQAQEHVPDLVICDIAMPDIDGYDVLTTLRQDPVTTIIPFIFLTGSNSKTDVRKAMELGADDYLTKPSTVDELLRAITSRLQKQASIQDWFAAKLQKAAKPVSVNKIPSNTPPKSIFPCVPQLKEVFDFIEANYDQGITLCDVAEAVGYSPAYLTNRVARQTGKTVNIWIVKRRMAEARKLLQNNNQTIEQIAKALGYQHVCHFSRQFRQHHGLPPHAWRKDQQAVDQVMLQELETAL